MSKEQKSFLPPEMVKAMKDIEDFTKGLHAILPSARPWRIEADRLFLKDNYEFTFDFDPSKLLEGSPYEYKGNNDFLHFTTIQNAFRILKDGHIRMSEFRNFTDQKELAFAAQAFTNSPHWEYEQPKLDAIKNQIFALSACEYNENTLVNPYLWEAYSHKGTGACLRFKLTTPASTQLNVGKVHYGINGLSPVIALRSAISKMMENGIPVPKNLYELFAEIFAFHKVRKFEVENEIRFFRRFKEDEIKDHSTVFRDVNSTGKMRYFNKLYILPRREIIHSGVGFDIANEYLPAIELVEICLGSNAPMDDYFEYLEVLKHHRDNNKYNFKVSSVSDENMIFPENLDWPT
jgi:hypothetical protein